MTKEIVVHKDKLGRVINLDDFVCYPDGNSLEIGKVLKLNAKMIKVRRIPDMKRKWEDNKNKYSWDCVLVDGKEVTMYILRNSA